jgi:hypothetical protein
MIVKLERDADHLRTALSGERGHDAAIDAARHGDDNAMARTSAVWRRRVLVIPRGASKIEADRHNRGSLLEVHP